MYKVLFTCVVLNWSPKVVSNPNSNTREFDVGKQKLSSIFGMRWLKKRKDVKHTAKLLNGSPLFRFFPGLSEIFIPGSYCLQQQADTVLKEEINHITTLSTFKIKD